jgi:hypothetical protein
MHHSGQFSVVKMKNLATLGSRAFRDCPNPEVSVILRASRTELLLFVSDLNPARDG